MTRPPGSRCGSEEYGAPDDSESTAQTAAADVSNDDRNYEAQNVNKTPGQNVEAIKKQNTDIIFNYSSVELTYPMTSLLNQALTLQSCHSN